jgi:hypothetical protein
VDAVSEKTDRNHTALRGDVATFLTDDVSSVAACLPAYTEALRLELSIIRVRIFDVVTHYNRAYFDTVLSVTPIVRGGTAGAGKTIVAQIAILTGGTQVTPVGAMVASMKRIPCFR